MGFLNSATGAFGGAATGFQIGAATGIPHVAGIGAVIGGIAGLFGGGGGSSGGGSGKGKTKKALKIQNQLTLDSLKRDTALAIQAQEKAAKLYDDLRDAKYAEDLKNYEIAVEQRQYYYEQARDAYEDSVDAFDETVELNDISASMAMNDARRVFNQRQQDLNVQGQSLMDQLNSGLRDTVLNKGLIESQMNASIKNAELNAQGINTNLRIALRDGGDAIKESTRAFEVATKTAQLELDVKDIQLGADKQMIKSEMATLEGEKNAMLASAQLKQDDVTNSLDNTIAESDFAQQTLALAQDERYAEAAVQTDQLRRQGLLEQSAQIAKGQSGRSAAKSIQGLAFANQQAQALLASAITRADSKYLIDKNKIVQSLGYARQQGQSELKSTSIGLDRSKSEYAAAGLRMSARRLELGIRGKEADMIGERLSDAKAQTQFQNTRTANQLKDAKSLATIDMAKLSEDLILSQKQFQTQLIKNKNQQDDLASQTKLSMGSIGFAQQSLSDELKISEERIEFDKMLANRAAESQVLDEPRVPDLLPPPIKAPPLIQEPAPDIDWKKIKKAMDKARKAGMAYNPSGISEFGQLMGNIQSIGQQAASVASAFAPPPQVQGANELFPIQFKQAQSNFSDFYNSSSLSQNLQQAQGEFNTFLNSQ